jgi:hypothetical protein
MDTKALWRHAIAYYFYLFSTVMFYSTYVFQINKPVSSNAYKWYNWASFLYWDFVMISNGLMSYIFYDILQDQLGADTEFEELEAENDAI